MGEGEPKPLDAAVVETAMRDNLDAYRRVRPLAALRCRIRNRIFDPRRVLPHVPQRGRLLDWGCGDGFTANLVARLFPALEVIGVDLSRYKLGLARAAQTASNVRFVCGEPPAGDYGAVLLLDLLHHVAVPRQLGLLGEACRKLRPGGTLVLKEIDGGMPLRALINQVHDLAWSREWVHARPRGVWQRELERQGLRVVEEVDCFVFGYPHYLMAARQAATTTPVR